MKASCRGLIEVPFRHMPGETEEKLEAVRIADAPTEIQKGWLRIRSPELCCHAILLREMKENM